MLYDQFFIPVVIMSYNSYNGLLDEDFTTIAVDEKWTFERKGGSNDIELKLNKEVILSLKRKEAVDCILGCFGFVISYILKSEQMTVISGAHGLLDKIRTTLAIKECSFNLLEVCQSLSEIFIAVVENNRKMLKDVTSRDIFDLFVPHYRFAVMDEKLYLYVITFIIVTELNRQRTLDYRVRLGKLRKQYRLC